MSYLIDKAGFAAQIYDSLASQSACPGAGNDSMRLIQLLAGVTVETLLLFDDPDEGWAATIGKLEGLLGVPPSQGTLGANALPPAYIMDYETEQGRGLARRLFEDWLDCAFEFHDLNLFIIHNLFIQLEDAGQSRGESFRLFVECAERCLGFELAAEELCDIVIEQKIGREGWNLAESVSGLSAIAGRCLALSQNACSLFSAPSLPEKLDQVAYVMTQEAIRLGIPAGSDWRFGLAANDGPCSAPYELIIALEPECRSLFRALGMHDLFDQSVACAKAAGRMLAVAAGGDTPELEPVIAKPLAMAAMTETYRTVCREEMILSC